MSARNVKALCFDVFGTATDWHGSIINEGEALAAGSCVALPWGEFVNKWRLEGYFPTLFKIASGEAEYISTEQIHKIKLLELLDEYGLTGLSEEEIAHFNRSWNRIKAWPDAAQGLTMMKEDFMIMPLSNGDYRSMLDIAKHNSLPWDGIISAEFFDKVKPDPGVYYGAAEMLCLEPDEIMMVACHAQDLEAARNCGLRTAYVNRPLEYGPDFPPEAKPNPFDYDADSFIELAEMLRADKAAGNV
jgi:2-haloacid dehalogenase